jgi:electron transport complex protein RnfD
MYISSSPHIGTPVNTRLIMGMVLLALAPVSVFGVFLYGIPALLAILVSVAAAEIAEALFRKITGQDIRNADLSAAVTGLLAALILPPGMPLWMVALGAAFGVIVGKEFFGGLGANVFNPALAGRAFLVLSFPAAATTWASPRAFFSAGNIADAVTGATPLGIVKLGGSVADVGAGFAASGLAVSADYWSTMRTLFFGVYEGCIGESSVLLILIGFLILFLSKTIDWRAPVSMTVSLFVFSFFFGRDPLFAVLSGGLLFGAVFMATDYVTAPLTAKGKLIFGFGAGLITALIRQWGNYPEGATYGILMMNAVTPFLNKLIQKKFGYVKPQKVKKAKAAGGEK